MCSDLYESVLKLHFALIEAANAELGLGIYDGVSASNDSKALALFDNLNKERIPADQISKVLNQCLNLNPYRFAFYQYILTKYADPDLSVENTASHFGIDISESKKEMILTEFEKIAENNDLTFDEKINTLQKISTQYGYSDIHPWWIDIAAKLRKQDEESRVNFVDSELAKVSSNTDRSLKSKLTLAESLCSRSGIPLDGQAYVQITSKLKDADNEARLSKANTVIDRIFSEDGNLESQQKIEKVKSELDKLGISTEHEEYENILSYSEQKDRAIRTVDNKVFETKKKADAHVRFKNGKEVLLVGAIFGSAILFGNYVESNKATQPEIDQVATLANTTTEQNNQQQDLIEPDQLSLEDNANTDFQLLKSESATSIESESPNKASDINTASNAQSPVEPAISPDGTEVYDPKTNLTWRRCVEGLVLGGNNTCQSKNDFSNYQRFSHAEALQHAEAESNRTGELWRLPSASELSGLLQGGATEASTYEKYYPNTPQDDWLWSSTQESKYCQVKCFWKVHFGTSQTDWEGEIAPHPIRLVRVGK